MEIIEPRSTIAMLAPGGGEGRDEGANFRETRPERLSSAGRSQVQSLQAPTSKCLQDTFLAERTQILLKIDSAVNNNRRKPMVRARTKPDWFRLGLHRPRAYSAAAANP
jgi:hypothetical protein